jgi:hypothetical protein
LAETLAPLLLGIYIYIDKHPSNILEDQLQCPMFI